MSYPVTAKNESPATEMPRLKALLSSPSVPTKYSSHTTKLTNSILSKQPEFASFGEGKLSQLIETLFPEDDNNS
jgi:hypothetical protein